MSEPRTGDKCPTACDDDCDATCHEGHNIRAHQLHDPSTCPSEPPRTGDTRTAAVCAVLHGPNHYRGWDCIEAERALAAADAAARAAGRITIDTNDATVSVVAALLGEELDWLTPAQIFAAAEVVVAGLVSEAGG